MSIIFSPSACGIDTTYFNFDSLTRRLAGVGTGHATQQASHLVPYFVLWFSYYDLLTNFLLGVRYFCALDGFLRLFRAVYGVLSSK